MHPRRPHDNKPTPYNNWPFMSVHFWDEPPYGSWSVEIKNAGPTRARGIVHKLKLKLYGTFSKRKHRDLLAGHKTIAEKLRQQQGGNGQMDEDAKIETINGNDFRNEWKERNGSSTGVSNLKRVEMGVLFGLC